MSDLGTMLVRMSQWEKSVTFLDYISVNEYDLKQGDLDDAREITAV